MAQQNLSDADTGPVAKSKIQGNFDELYASAVPAGGSLGQVLAKASASDYDTEWATPSGGGSPGGINTQYQINNAGAFGGGNLFQGTNIIELSNGTAAQAFRIERSFTDVSNRGYTELRQDATTGFILDSVNLGSVGAPTNVLDVRVNGASALVVKSFFGGVVTVLAKESSAQGFFEFEGGNGQIYYNKSGIRSFGLGQDETRVYNSSGLSFATDARVGQGVVWARIIGDSSGVLQINSGTAGQFRDLRLRSAIQVLPASITPANNGELVAEATSNTSLTFKYRGSDGTVRSASLTLS